MEERKSRKTTRLKGVDYNSAGLYFITMCTAEKRCILSRVVGTGVLDGPQIELTPYGKVANKYLLQLNDFYDNIQIDRYVIMPNHVHIILFLHPFYEHELDTEGGTPRTSSPQPLLSWFSILVN